VNVIPAVRKELPEKS